MEDKLVYREVLSRGTRTFDLFADRIVVHVKYPNYSAEFTILLSGLRPIPNTVRLREWPFKVGLSFLFASLIAGAYSFQGGQLIRLDVVGVAIGFAILGVVICVYCFRKIEFASFMTHGGITVLDVGDSGPDRTGYRHFVEQLLANIRAAQTPH